MHALPASPESGICSICAGVSINKGAWGRCKQSALAPCSRARLLSRTSLSSRSLSAAAFVRSIVHETLQTFLSLIKSSTTQSVVSLLALEVERAQGEILP